MGLIIFLAFVFISIIPFSIIRTSRNWEEMPKPNTKLQEDHDELKNEFEMHINKRFMQRD